MKEKEAVCVCMCAWSRRRILLHFVVVNCLSECLTANLLGKENWQFEKKQLFMIAVCSCQ